jgi:glucose/arabinose dehydrogenase
MKLRFVPLMCGVLFVAACIASPAPRIEVSTATRPVSTPTAVPSTATPAPQPTSTPHPSPAPTRTSTSTASASGSFSIALQALVDGLERPTYLTDAGDDRLFVVEQPGRIRIIANGQLLDQPFLDITDLVLSTGNEQGLFSVAFSPDYQTSRRFFIDYTRQSDGATVIARYTVSDNDPNAADPASAKTILTIAQPEPNHNGGQLQFGPDGYLYIGMGDGGGAGDQHGATGNGQNLKALLGKLLRIDVTNQDTYAIPASNPFGTEIWAYGLRNPWRFSFDRATGDLYIADVGQNTYEEVDFQPASSRGGENYGWRIMEGLHCYDADTCDQSGLVLPVAEYSHNVGGCSITGGYIYRGSKYPVMQGTYFFGDYCSGIIWSLQRDAGGQWQMTRRLRPDANISSFGQDRSGELYVVDLSGAIYKLVAQ